MNIGNKVIKILLIANSFLFITHITCAQEHHDWAFTYLNYFKVGDDAVTIQICNDVEVKHRVVVSDSYGEEFYCSGNLHAAGAIKKKNTVTYITKDGKETLRTEYVRNGEWKIYYDSIVRLLRSEGAYRDGKEDGKWMIYYKNGKPKYEYEFTSGYTKSKIHYHEDGKREILVNKSFWNILVEKYKILLILLAAVPIVAIRISWNILTYNQIHKSNYIPFLQNWQKGGWEVNLFCTFTFWWIINANDTVKVRGYKTTANWISLSSTVWFALIILIFIFYGEK